MGLDGKFGWRAKVPCPTPCHSILLLQTTCQWVGVTFLLDAVLNSDFLKIAFPHAEAGEVTGTPAWFLQLENHLVSNSVSHRKKVVAAV